MLTAEDYAKAFAPLRKERENRIRRSRPVEVVDHAKFGGPKRTQFGSEGSMIVFVGRNQDFIRKAMAALEGGAEEMQRLIKQIDTQMGKLKGLSVDEAASVAAQQESFGSLGYGGATLIDPLFLPKGLDLTCIMLPYNGGRLARSGFVLVDHVAKGDVEGLQSFVLQTKPQLTAAERAALAKVPIGDLIGNIGSGYSCEFTTVAAGAFAIAFGLGGAAGGPAGAAAGAVAGAAVGAGVDAALTHVAGGGVMSRDAVHIADAEIARLGPSMSAARLVALRRDAMIKASQQAQQQR